MRTCAEERSVVLGETESFGSTLSTEIIKWAVPVVGALIAVFFTPLIEFLKLRLNRAEMRIKQYEEFARDISAFVFQAELQHEFLTAGWNQENITKNYNGAITDLRSKELIYLSWAKRYWSPTQMTQFTEILQGVRIVDKGVHAFNDGEVTELKLNNLDSSLKTLKASVLNLLGRPPSVFGQLQV